MWKYIAVHSIVDGVCACRAGRDCKSAGKHPVERQWRNAGLSEAELLAHRGNLGIVTGPPSGVWVLDIDAGSGGMESLGALQKRYGDLPPTRQAATGGGGQHYYFTWPTEYDVRNSASLVAQGIDVRGDGGFVVVPPSISAKGAYTWLNDLPVAEAPEWLYTLMKRRNRAKTPEELMRGSRNTTLTSIGGALRRSGHERDAIETALKGINTAYSQGDPLDDEEVESIAGSVSRYDPEPVEQSFTDSGNLERFAQIVGERVRHSYELGWLAWTGKQWKRDEKLVHQQARRVHELVRAEVASIENIKKVELGLKWAEASLSRSRIDSVVAMAEKDPRFDVTVEDMDAEPWLFNTENGIVDLRTGKRLPHAPEYLITKMSPTVYDPAAQCPTWEWFLKDIFQGDEDLVAFMQRSAGILLTGDTTEHRLWFLYGAGRNGKSVLVETLLKVLGKDYGTEAAIGLLEQKTNEGHTTDIAELRGIRFLTANETQEGKRMDEARVKQLTGGDTLKGRHMRQDNMVFTPTHHLWLRGNHRPLIRDTTVSIWDRVLLIPFKRTYTDAEQDKSLPEKLAREAPGILAWMVRGCLDWQKNGLQVPDVVRAATEEYRAEMDPLGAFIDEMCEVDADAVCTRAELYTRYIAWASANNERELSNRALASALRERGFEEKRNASVRAWKGIRVLKQANASTGG